MNGNFGAIVMDYARKFNMEVEVDGKKEQKEFYRRYNFMIPMGTSFDEVYGVIAEISADIKKMEEDNKKAVADKEAKTAVEEKSVA